MVDNNKKRRSKKKKIDEEIIEGEIIIEEKVKLNEEIPDFSFSRNNNLKFNKDNLANNNSQGLYRLADNKNAEFKPGFNTASLSKLDSIMLDLNKTTQKVADYTNPKNNSVISNAIRFLKSEIGLSPKQVDLSSLFDYQITRVYEMNDILDLMVSDFGIQLNCSKQNLVNLIDLAQDSGIKLSKAKKEVPKLTKKFQKVNSELEKFDRFTQSKEYYDKVKERVYCLKDIQDLRSFLSQYAIKEKAYSNNITELSEELDLSDKTLDVLKVFTTNLDCYKTRIENGKQIYSLTSNLKDGLDHVVGGLGVLLNSYGDLRDNFNDTIKCFSSKSSYESLKRKKETKIDLKDYSSKLTDFLENEIDDQKPGMSGLI